MIAPDMFGTRASVFLGLVVASDLLQDAQSDEDLVGVADFLWAMALQIENGSLADAERDLRAAEQRLRDALQRNASPDEIRKLADNLRAAMDKFLREFAARQTQRAQDGMRARDAPQSVSRQDLQSMLDRMMQMANAGDRQDAQKMLEQLQNTLENLRMAGQRDQDPQMGALNKAMRELNQLTRDQQKLRDETQRLARAQDQDSDAQQNAGNDQEQSQPGQQKPPPPTPWSKARAYYHRGRAYFQMGKYAQAISDYSRSIQFNPYNPDVYNSRGFAYRAVGDTQHAETDFETAKGLNQ